MSLQKYKINVMVNIILIILYMDQFYRLYMLID